ncbi:EamA family transporter RarD [Pandoraea nosoerga]|uniref:Chemotaxis protein n=1 Tax=Pandoraea nosoerga TaxID=2508296 RepID=A0A5E4XUU0_9BURK|nr:MULTISPECIES: EamA family transporter RarD [Pandoraea]MBN4667535.1 EamA family transporter RarD [Pandoraea nosoerga]MBN4674865.1 EamA family transporter RarD [Pandoraea nosoerga]MBN4680181.1 EamA family transporter RarD [Pandoraea nosoerga]MBN4744585.1 EamA family transporter RarD [Pandoraea nosoerga]VVE39828.1 chemotaxis protein [Pandoraea nosoerga]
MLSGRGVTLSVSASVMFSIMPALVAHLTPLSGLDVFAWRILLTLPGTLVIVAALRRWHVLGSTFSHVLHRPAMLGAVLLCSAMLAVQLWLFMWAPLQQRMLDASLGYFLLPLTMVLAGRTVYKERLSPLQTAAVIAAALGVAHELWATRALSWVTAVIMFGYPPYFMLRRRLRIDALSGFILELMAMTPVAAVVLWQAWPQNALVMGEPRFWFWLPALGLLSAGALASTLAAARILPIGVYGILSYVEPVLLFAVSVFLLGEPFTASGLWTYVPIWIGVALIVFDSLRTLHRQRLAGELRPPPDGAGDV